MLGRLEELYCDHDSDADNPSKEEISLEKLLEMRTLFNNLAEKSPNKLLTVHYTPRRLAGLSLVSGGDSY